LQTQDFDNADWNKIEYMGRGEKFYKYGGFNRDISLSFTVTAQSREELSTMYRKLNFLASSLAPYYSEKGYMGGNIANLTVGDYLQSVPGIITGLTLTPIFEAGWDLNRDNDGIIQREGDEETNGYVGQLPMAIKVDGFNFTPIHDFTPSKNSPFINGVTYSNSTVQLTDTIGATGDTGKVTEVNDITGNYKLNEDGELITERQADRLQRKGWVKRTAQKLKANQEEQWFSDGSTGYF
jgi:hypothetical protein